MKDKKENLKKEKMFDTTMKKIVVVMLSVIVTISVIAYLNTLPKPVFEKPYWISIVALLFLYWVIFIDWYSKRKK